MLDLDLPSERDLDVVIREIASASKESQIAYRGSERFVARLTRHKSESSSSKLQLREDGSYLITGGLGGIGLEVASWLAKSGSKEIILMGRSEPSEATKTAIAALEAQGATVHVVKGDVSIEMDVRRCLQTIKSKCKPLRGIFHTAGVLKDAALMQQNWEQFQTTFSSKAKGVWNLHKLTATMEMDFFVLFSSVTSLVGNRGQANYAAANSFLDAFAHYRRGMGLTALSVNWGPWSEVGMAKKSSASQKQLGEIGMDLISPKFGIETLQKLMIESVVQVGVIL